jgi:hypothetical protein
MGLPDADTVWAREQVETFPASWVQRLLSRWRGRHGANAYAANIDHLTRCKAIKRAQRAGVQADANDEQIRQEATDSARDMERRLAYGDQIMRRRDEPCERLLMLGKMQEALHWLAGRDLVEDFVRQCRVSIPGALRRLTCERWWRRVLRKMHARAVEATARGIGLVHKRAGCYVSDDGVKRRTGQNLRNAMALESVRAINEHGQDYTLAELAAKGPANREIRRHELMTRIAGFELIARECSHEALFVTVTCPSRMHAWRTKKAGWGVEENPRHDGTTPDVAQQYLAQQWGRFLSACARWGVSPYGFRIAEPNHDGTPHWHALLFVPREVEAGTVAANPRAGRPVAVRVLLRLLRRYFLRTGQGVEVDGKLRLDEHERGARKHRVVVERIDWSRGSAAGYVAKYVAKNIDGYKVEKDLYGNDAMTSSRRVDAWASTWRIRQFQQIGGAPVTIWRELRRLHPEQGDAAPAVLFALDAVNVAKATPKDPSEQLERYTAATGWAAYLELQGGARVPRKDLRVRLLRELTGEVGRYGELMPPKVVGVVTDDTRRVSVDVLGKAVTVRRTVRAEVESERSAWIIVPGGFAGHARDCMHGAQAQREALRPWSPVNNSTRPVCSMLEAPPLFGPDIVRTRKVGRWHNWNGGVRTEKAPDDPPSHANGDAVRRSRASQSGEARD